MLVADLSFETSEHSKLGKGDLWKKGLSTLRSSWLEAGDTSFESSEVSLPRFEMKGIGIRLGPSSIDISGRGSKLKAHTGVLV